VRHGELAERLVERAVERVGQREHELAHRRLSGELPVVVRDLRCVRVEQERDRADRRRAGARGGAARADQGRRETGVLGKEHERVRRGGRVDREEMARDVVDPGLDEAPSRGERGIHEGRDLVVIRLVADGVGHALLLPDGEEADGRGIAGSRDCERGEHGTQSAAGHAGL